MCHLRILHKYSNNTPERDINCILRNVTTETGQADSTPDIKYSSEAFWLEHSSIAECST